MLSKPCKYAIRAVLYLAQDSTKKSGAKTIADKLDIPAPFLAKTLQELTRKHIISSVKGPNGGFFLSEDNKTKKIIDIIHCFDGVEVFDNCFIGRANCSNENPCEVHHVYIVFKQKILNIFSNYTIIDLINKDISINKLLS